MQPTQSPPAPGTPLSRPSAPGNGTAAPRGPKAPPVAVRPVPRRRLPALISLGMLLVLGCGALGGWLFLRADQSTRVIRVVKPIGQGQVITRDHLAGVDVKAGKGVQLVPAARAAEVIGQRALVPLSAGSLLSAGQFGPDSGLRDGTTVVGLALKDGAMPAAGLQPGDLVAIIQTPTANGGGGGGGAVLSRNAVVRFTRATATGDTTIVDVVVPFRDATGVSRAGAAGSASVVLLPSSGAAADAAPSGDSGNAGGDGKGTDNGSTGNNGSGSGKVTP